MKKTASIILKILAGFIIIIIILLFTLPVIFKDKIRIRVEQAIAASVNADVKFTDYSLGFFRNFPNLNFSLKGLSVVGVDKFGNDTLASVRSFNLVFSLPSLFKNSGYEVKSIIVDRAEINTRVLKDGSANWDISKQAKEPAQPPVPREGSSSIKILLEKVSLNNSSLTYLDSESNIQVYMNDLNLIMKGGMAMGETDMQIKGKSGEFSYVMDGVKYLNKAVIDADLNLLADFEKMKFTFRENWLSVNDMKLNFSGYAAMPKEDIETDIQFKTAQTSFGALLSLIPAVYMKDYKDLKTKGEFILSGTAKGIYSDADSTIPDLTLSLSVTGASVSYPSLPEEIKNINIKSNLYIDGKQTDRSTVAVDLFHMELAGSPFDMKFELKTPVSDPDFKGSMAGHIDLSALSRALPMDSIKLSGIIDLSVAMAGRMSMLEKQQYENFSASGKMNIQNMLVKMKGYPEVKVNRAGFEFTPAYAAMTDADIIIGGKSDFSLNGRLSNYIPYLLRNKTIRGNMSMHSKFIDVTGSLPEKAAEDIIADKSAVPVQTSKSVVKVPENIDFDFDALIDELKYENIDVRKAKGHIIVRNGILTLKETDMEIMDGTLSMNAEYDTRDTLKPLMKAELDLQNIGAKDAFNTFNTVKQLAPAAKGIDGKINVRFGFQSLLGLDMMPVVSSINGEGKLKADEITLAESETFDKVKETLKLGDNYSNTFKDVNIDFKIREGRIYVSPFDVRTGNLRMNISGDQGIDQSLNYLVKTEMPRSDLGGSVNALIDNLAKQAAAFGITYKPSEVIKINLSVTGTFTRPVIMPVFGNKSASGTSGNESVKEASKAAGDLAKEKARAEAEKEAAHLIKEAEDKAQILRDEAASAAETIRKEADIQAKKLIDDSANKSSLEKLATQKGADALKKNADKKAAQLVKEADTQASKLIEEAKVKGEELIKNI